MGLGQFFRRELGFSRVIWVLFFGNLVSATGRFMMRPFMTVYIYTKFHVPLSQLGWFIGASSLLGVFTSFVAGTVADRVGRTPVMIASLLASAAVVLGFTLTNSLAVFTALFVLDGAVTALFFPASSASIADVTPPEQRVQAYGLIRIAVNIGAVIGPMAAGLIGMHYQTTFTVTAACFTVFALAVIFFVPETRPSQPDSAPGTDAGSYTAVFADSLLMLFVFAGLLVSTGYAQMETTLPIYMTKELGMTLKQYGWLLAANGAMVVVLQVPITWAIGSWRTSTAMAISSILYAVGFGSYIVMHRFTPMLLGMGVITMGEMIASPSYSKFVADIAPADLRGRYMAVSSLGWAVSGVVGPIIGSSLMGAAGGAVVWLMASGFCAVATVLYLYLGRRTHRGLISSGKTSYN